MLKALYSIFLLTAGISVYPSTISSFKNRISYISLCDIDSQHCSIPYTHITDVTEPSQFVAVLPNGIVVDSGHIVTANQQLVRDFEHYDDRWPHQLYGNWDSRLQRRFLDEDSNGIDFFDGSLAILSIDGEKNYYHWLLQILPRLATLMQSAIPFDKIYISNISSAWQKESLSKILRFFNISSEKLMIVGDDLAIQARVLIVPSLPYIPSKGERFPHWVRKFLCSVFLDSPAQGEFCCEKIFISRSQASYRRIINEKELRYYLEERGFKTLILEELSLEEQARCFNAARIIIGPHGAGFANLVFAEPGAVVVEIDHQSIGDPRSHFRIFSKVLGCQYHPFYTSIKVDDQMEDDIFVDMDQFAKHLKNLCIA